jgi:hypothetical protein
LRSVLLLLLLLLLLHPAGAGLARASTAQELLVRRKEYAQLRRRRHPAGKATAICAHGAFSFSSLAVRPARAAPQRAHAHPAAALRCDPGADYKVWNRRFSAPEIYNNCSTVDELVASMALFGFSEDTAWCRSTRASAGSRSTRSYSSAQSDLLHLAVRVALGRKVAEQRAARGRALLQGAQQRAACGSAAGRQRVQVAHHEHALPSESIALWWW